MSRKRGQKGQAMVEMAMSMGILATLLLGALSMGRYAYDRMIVREAVEEAGKLAMIDRPRPDTNNSVRAWQMSNKDLFEWVQAAATEADPAIHPGDVRVSDGQEPWKFVQATNTPGAMGSAPLITQLVNALNSKLSVLHIQITTQEFTRAINPGAETMRVNYRYNSGLGADWTWDSEIDFDFTRYTMFTLPFSPEERGDFPGEHS